MLVLVEEADGTEPTPRNTMLAKAKRNKPNAEACHQWHGNPRISLCYSTGDGAGGQLYRHKTRVSGVLLLAESWRLLCYLRITKNRLLQPEVVHDN
jgi:hypothetical protein